MGTTFECWEMDLSRGDGLRDRVPMRLLDTHFNPPNGALLEITDLAHHKYCEVLQLLDERRACYDDSTHTVSLHGITAGLAGSDLSAPKLIIYFSVGGEADIAPMPPTLDNIKTNGLLTYLTGLGLSEKTTAIGVDNRRMRPDILETAQDTGSRSGDATDNQNLNKRMPQSPVAPDRIHTDAPEPLGSYG